MWVVGKSYDFIILSRITLFIVLRNDLISPQRNLVKKFKLFPIEGT